MSDELGAGIALDEDLDVSVGSTGDLKNESGVDELRKDLAFNMILSLQQYLGSPPGGNLEEKVAATAYRVALADSRIESVDKGATVVRFFDSREELELIITASTVGAGEQELVFNL